MQIMLLGYPPQSCQHQQVFHQYVRNLFCYNILQNRLTTLDLTGYRVTGKDLHGISIPSWFWSKVHDIAISLFALLSNHVEGNETSVPAYLTEWHETKWVVHRNITQIFQVARGNSTVDHYDVVKSNAIWPHKDEMEEKTDSPWFLFQLLKTWQQKLCTGRVTWKLHLPSSVSSLTATLTKDLKYR